MSGRSFNSYDALYWLLSEDRVSQTRGDMRELLVVSPLDLILISLIVIVVTRSRSVLKSLLVVIVLGLRIPGSRRLSPPVIELEIDVVQMAVGRFTVSDLIVLCGNVAFLLKVFWTNLCNMHVNHVCVVAVNFHQLFLVVAVHIDVVTWADVLMGKDILGLAVLVARSLYIPHLQVAGLFLLINLEKEVLFSDNFFIS
jgi:hypothetical protein